MANSVCHTNMGQKVSKKSKALTNSDFEFISIQTGLQQSDIKDFYSGFSLKKSMSSTKIEKTLGTFFKQNLGTSLIFWPFLS